MYLTTELMLFISINVKTRHSRRFALQSMSVLERVQSTGLVCINSRCFNWQHELQVTQKHPAEMFSSVLMHPARPSSVRCWNQWSWQVF